MKSIFHLNPVALVAAGGPGVGLRSFDIFGQSPIPEDIGIEIKVLTNGTAPGASKTVTVHYAFSGDPDSTVDQLSEADATQSLGLVNTADQERIYTLPTLVVAQRYLYVWFDSDALSGGAALTVTPTINT